MTGLSACPNGNVVGLQRDGTVIQFLAASPGAWRRVGRLTAAFKGGELTCANVDSKETALLVANAVDRTWVIRMDVATGSWSQNLVTNGTSVGIAFDPITKRIFVPSIKEHAIYYVSPTLKGPVQWTSIFGGAESISSVAVDEVGRRLLVGDAFSGNVHLVSLDTRRQDTLAEGMGSVNSLSIDQKLNRVYIADAGRRTIWVVQLAANASQKPRAFFRSNDLKDVSGVAADNRSNVWISVGTPGKVTVIGPDGKRRVATFE